MGGRLTMERGVGGVDALGVLGYSALERPTRLSAMLLARGYNNIQPSVGRSPRASPWCLRGVLREGEAEGARPANRATPVAEPRLVREASKAEEQ